MPLRALSCLLASSACLFAQPSGGFHPKDAIQAEWSRALPPLTPAEAAALSAADRARYERSLARIGAPGAPDLLPAELAHPTKELWEKKAAEARTPQARFTALFFLNRFKAPDALAALSGLTAKDAKAWPEHLHLEGQIAAARINGAGIPADLQGFLDAMQKAGKVDPVRAQAARLRLVMAGKERALLPPVAATPDAVLSLMDAFNRAPAPARETILKAAGTDRNAFFAALGCRPFPQDHAMDALIAQRFSEGDPAAVPAAWLQPGFSAPEKSVRQSLLGVAGKLPAGAAPAPSLQDDPVMEAAWLPSLRALDPAQADALRAKLLAGPSTIARAAAIDDLPSAPADLEALAKRCFADADLESALELFTSLDRWKLAPDQQKAILTPFLQHPDWGWRYQAYLQLKKMDPATAWPSAPAERPMDKALLDEAMKLAKRGKPVRLRVTFSGRRVVTLKLDPAVAPMNVANLVLLARKRFFDGRRVPRVVPDFVVQMGSPFDTMEGGPGYSVRCEDSPVWYSPGSVGMALAGKDTGGCQFFITTNATPHLTGKYTRLGEVENPAHDLKILDGLELGAEIESVRVLD